MCGQEERAIAHQQLHIVKSGAAWQAWSLGILHPKHVKPEYVNVNECCDGCKSLLSQLVAQEDISHITAHRQGFITSISRE